MTDKSAAGAETIRIRPVTPDARIIDPASGVTLPYYEEGVIRPRNPHWLRQIAHGDCVEVDEPSSQPPSKSAKSK